MQDGDMCECIQPRDRKMVYGPESSIALSIALCLVLLGSM